MISYHIISYYIMAVLVLSVRFGRICRCSARCTARAHATSLSSKICSCLPSLWSSSSL